MMDTWQELAAIASGVVVVGGGLFAVVRHTLRGEFVTRTEHQAITRRLETIETAVAQVPRHTDLLALERRLGDLAAALAALTASTQAVKEDAAAIRHQMNMLFEANLAEDKR